MWCVGAASERRAWMATDNSGLAGPLQANRKDQRAAIQGLKTLQRQGADAGFELGTEGAAAVDELSARSSGGGSGRAA